MEVTGVVGDRLGVCGLQRHGPLECSSWSEERQPLCCRRSGKKVK